MVSFDQLRAKVVRRIPASAYGSMLRYLRRSRPSLWGAEQPPNFLEATLLYTLYMDIKNIGVNRLVKKLDELGFRLSNRSVAHNSKEIRRHLVSWGRSKISPGPRATWDRAAWNMRRLRRLLACDAFGVFGIV